MGSAVHNILAIKYEKNKKYAYEQLELRKKNVYSKIPRIEEIDDKIKSLGLAYNKKILLNNTQRDLLLFELEEKIKLLKQEKDALLIKNDFSKNHLEPWYECGNCKDTGFVEIFGTIEKCSCYKQNYINFLYNQSNLSLLDKENFLTFDETLYSSKDIPETPELSVSPQQNILWLKQQCINFIENFDNPEEKNLIFCGPTGVGKTFMSNCIANEILTLGKTVLYQTAPKLFDIIGEYKLKAFKDSNYDRDGYNNIFESELLIIDDLGTETQSSSRYSELLSILNTRQNNNIKKSCKTILSTNLNLKELHNFYTERVASRIIGGFKVLKFYGEDIRKIKASRRNPSK